ncbi:MAG: carbohydrate ABC transporter permease [Opitutales bacterium]
MTALGFRNRWIASGAAIFASALCAYPFAWMFFSSFKTNKEIYQPSLFFPSDYEFDSFASLLSGDLADGISLPFSFVEVFLHSVLASGSQALFATMLTAMAGYAFAKFRFRGKRFLFLLAILVILIPRQALAVPLFEWINQLNLNGKLWAVILPGVANGIGVVFFTLIFRRVPDSLMDLAQVEGASEARTFLVLLPLVSPALVTYGLIHFILAWQEHLFPLLLLTDDNQVLPLALAKLRDSSYRIPEAVSMAAATCSLLPVAILFAIFHRQIRSALRDFTAH